MSKSIMKWWKIDIDHANDHKIWDLLERFGMGGYGFYIWTLNNLHTKEEDGYQIEVTDTWIRKTAHECFISDKHTVIRYLDAFAEIGLINGQLWAEKIVYSDEILQKADAYMKLKIKERDKKRNQRLNAKLKAESTEKPLLSPRDKVGTVGDNPNVPPADPDPDPYSDPEEEKIKEIKPLDSLDFPDEMVDPLIKATMPVRPIASNPVQYSPGFSDVQFMEFFQYVVPHEAQKRQNKIESKKKFMTVQGVDYKTFKDCYKKYLEAYKAKNPNEKAGDKYQYLKGLPRWIDEEGWLEFIPEHLRGGSLDLEMVIAGLPRSFNREAYMILPDGDWRVNAGLCSAGELAAFTRGSYRPECYRRIRPFEMAGFLEQNPGVIHLKDMLVNSKPI
jgi:hypothetical protein